MNVPITCGGIAVNPGDLIVADDDGVAVVPLSLAEEVKQKCQARIAEKMNWKQKTQEGVSTAELWELKPPK